MAGKIAKRQGETTFGRVALTARSTSRAKIANTQRGVCLRASTTACIDVPTA